jgi:hypothetical protein
MDSRRLRAHCRTVKRLLLILAVIAALLGVGLGSAVATTLVTSATIKDHTIKNVDVASDAVDSRVVKNKSIVSADLAPKARTTWAHVNAAGTLARSSGGATSASLGVDGQYSVNFGRDVSKCAYVATIDYSSGGYEGEISVAPREGNANAVFAQTYIFDPGMDANMPFYLAVFC